LAHASAGTTREHDRCKLSTSEEEGVKVRIQEHQLFLIQGVMPIVLGQPDMLAKWLATHYTKRIASVKPHTNFEQAEKFCSTMTQDLILTSKRY
jgi:hypothetical protein